MKHLCTVLVVLVLALCSASSGWAAATGTAWGTLIGSPTYDASGYHLQLNVTGYPGGDETIVDCGTWGSWCAGILSNETVVVSFTNANSLMSCGGVIGTVLMTHLRMDGVSKQHYCYPGSCGT